MSGRPLTYDSALSIESHDSRKALESLPDLGDVVRLLVPGPPLIVVDRPKPHPFGESPPVFDDPIGVVYCDSSGHVSHGVVPFGCLVKECF
jgi:hypothetical protein